MKHIFKKVMQMLSCVAMTTLLLSSCGESGTGIDYLAVKMSKSDGWSIIDKDGKVIVEDEYPSDATLSIVRDGAYWVKTGNTFQLFSIDSPKKPIIDEEFTCATGFRAGCSAVSAPNQPIRIINTKGEIVTTLSEDIKRCYLFSHNGYATYIDSDNKYGVIDKNGNIVVKAEYHEMQLYLWDNVFVALKNEDDKKIVILNTEGKKLGTIDTEKYTLQGIYSEGKILVTSKDDSDSRLIALDKEGKRLFSIKKSSHSDVWTGYKDGFVEFRNAEGKYGVADAEGNEVIRAKYNNIRNLGNGEFAVSKDDNKWGGCKYQR